MLLMGRVEAELRLAWTGEGARPHTRLYTAVPTLTHPSLWNHCGLIAIRLGRQSGALAPWPLHMLGLLLSLMLT